MDNKPAALASRYVTALHGLEVITFSASCALVCACLAYTFDMFCRFTTMYVGSVFLYLTDYSLQKRSREMAKRALEKKITLPDLAAADLDNDGSISKLDFVISKQLDSLDHGIYGKITLADLMETV
ncbi:hypothetical protein KIW84_011291 [Lathyrus oleraceus]|uniref:EF-hand domain-containing protein n=1 Tax=Pisum sativum TaxID=3888 RepID=A0A9D4YN83_PEA|nr:hypothetical protein KIW84_011291 [Pisum sativum]